MWSVFGGVPPLRAWAWPDLPVLSLHLWPAPQHTHLSGRVLKATVCDRCCMQTIPVMPWRKSKGEYNNSLFSEAFPSSTYLSLHFIDSRSKFRNRKINQNILRWMPPLFLQTLPNWEFYVVNVEYFVVTILYKPENPDADHGFHEQIHK